MTASIQGAPIPVRLQSITFAARDTHLFEFVRADGGLLPAAAAGAHVEVHLPNGLKRQYSLVDAADAPRSYVVGVKRDPHSRGGSQFMHEQLRAGATLALSPPRNNFPLHESAPHSVLIAGGIGITPIWCMAQRLQRIGASWELWYSCRSRADAAFLPALAQFGGRVRLHFDEEAGSLLDLAAVVAAAPPGAHLYCCGPAPMLAAYEAAAAARRPQTVHLERFGAAQAAATGGGFIVRLARSGRELAVAPGASILDVLQGHGVAVNTSCLQGVCGYCETAVLEGEVEHRDSILTPSERASNSTMMVCCSGAKSAVLVLDL